MIVPNSLTVLIRSRFSIIVKEGIKYIFQISKNFTIIQDGNNQNHKRGEVKFPDQCNEHEAKLHRERENPN